MSQNTRKPGNNAGNKTNNVNSLHTFKTPVKRREVMRLYEKGLVRDLLVPVAEPTTYPMYVDKKEFQRLTEKAKVITEKEKKKMKELAEAKKHTEVYQCVDRKEKMRSFSLQKHKHSAKLDEFEREAKRKTLHLLRKAFELRQEQEDEVKKANRLIMATKCHAIRDAQIRERDFLRRQQEQEDERLDQMMEDERRRALLADEKEQEKKRLEKENYVKLITEQIKQNETEHVLEMERKDEEARLINEANYQIKIEEFDKYKQKLDEQAKMREMFDEINRKILEMHEKEHQEKVLEDLKIQDFIQRKAEREEAWEKEMLEIKKAKDREISRLQALQKGQSDLKADLDEMNAKRVQNEVERQWRLKEKEAARKKLIAQEALKKARELQVESQIKSKSMEIAREKQDYEKVLRVQRESFEKQKLEELKKRCLLEEYRSDIMRQINEKEKERIRERQKTYQEGIALNIETATRTRHINEVLHKKIEELRKFNLPEEYVQEIERQLRSITTTTGK